MTVVTWRTSATSTADEFTYDLVAPTVTEIYPSSGAGLELDVEVVGTNMFDVSAVDFGTVAGTVTYVDPGGSYLKVTAPAGTGAVNVRVKNTARTSPVVAAGQVPRTRSRPGAVPTGTTVGRPSPRHRVAPEAGRVVPTSSTPVDARSPPTKSD